MAQQQNIKKNYIYNTIYRIFTIITPLITTPYVARIFGAEIIGIQSYVGAILSYFTMFAALGTYTYGQREIAMCRDDRERASKKFWEIETLSVITTSICLVVWIGLIFFVKEYKLYYIILTMNLIGVGFDISWFFGGYENFRLITIRNIIIKAIGIIILFTLVHSKDDIFLYLGLTAASGLIGNISLWFSLPRYLVKVKLKTFHLKEHFKQTLIYFIPTVATSIYLVLDKVMIGMITNEPKENGYYEETSKITKMMLTIITSLNFVMSARMAYLYATDRVEELKDRLKKSMNFVMLLSIPMVLGIIGIAKNFVPWFFGPGFEKVTYLLYIYSPLIIIIGISNCAEEQYLTPSGQRKRSAKSVIVGAIVNFCCNLILIPFLKSVGAAMASIIGEIVVTVMCVYMSEEYMTWRIIFKYIWKRAIAGVAMLLAVFVIGFLPLNRILITGVQVGIGAIVYFGLLILMKDELAREYTIYNLSKVKKIVIKK